PLFDLSSPSRGPFPADRFARSDPAQNTCETVNLPGPADCASNASECVEIDLLNHVDGFNVRPRLSIPFGYIESNDSIDVTTVTSSTVFLVTLGETLVDGAPSCAPLSAADFDDEDQPLPPDSGRTVGISQIVLDTDPDTHQ